MSRKLFFLGVLSLILAPGAALSVGLGEIRLNSYLNQPLNAEVTLSVSSPEEMQSLKVGLAPMEAFERFGLDRPAYFDDLRFQVQSSGPSTATVLVTSSRPVTEPFVTFLIEAEWIGGRALREYTVLLDPPVFMPGPAVESVPAPAAAPPPAPVTETPAPAPAPVARPAPSPAPVATPTPTRSDFGSEYGPVQRNDTLWAIAQRVRPDDGITTNQIMVALFRENPRAFDGNINRLRAGVVLRVPSRDQMAAASAREATAEVVRQNEAWRAGTAAPVVERRLELAPPAETASPPAPAAESARDASASSPAPAEQANVQELRGDLDEARRLVELKDAEIAALEARLAELEAAAAPAAPGESQPAATAPEPAPAAEAAAPAPAPAPAPSLMERVFGLLGSLWLWLVLAIVLVLAAVAVFLRSRKEQERSIEEDLAETGTWGTLDDSGGKYAAGGTAAAVKAGAESRAARGESMVVEESGPGPREKPKAPPPAPAPGAEAAAEEEYKYPFEDTIAGETGIYLDQSDPMTEADFHMAYGLYDQAAEIIRKAVQREPDRYDLRRKLLDICFVWGNAEEFLAQAKAIRELGGEEAVADWPKIGIMGRQICPGEPLFEAAEAGEAAAGDVDLDLGSTAAAAAGASASEEWLDFDVGAADESLPSLSDTREQPAPDLEEFSPEQTAELNLEDLGMDLELGETGEYALQDLAERAPEFEDEATAEESEDGLPTPEDDGGTMQFDPAAMRRVTEEPTQRGEGWELAEDEPTVAGVGGFEDETDEADQTLIKKFEPSYEAPTTSVGGFEDDDEELGLDDLTQALKADVDIAEDAAEDDATRLTAGGEAEPATGHELGDTVEMPPAGLEEPGDDVEPGDTAEMPPSEMDEVGTKLDLARAYIDMGDPEGARSILGEVLEEGEEAQREEARELLDSLD